MTEFIYQITSDYNGITVIQLKVEKETEKTFKVSGKTYRSMIRKDEIGMIQRPFIDTFQTFSFDRDISDIRTKSIEHWVDRKEHAIEAIEAISSPDTFKEYDS